MRRCGGGENGTIRSADSGELVQGEGAPGQPEPLTSAIGGGPVGFAGQSVPTAEDAGAGGDQGGPCVQRRMMGGRPASEPLTKPIEAGPSTQRRVIGGQARRATAHGRPRPRTLVTIAIRRFLRAPADDGGGQPGAFGTPTPAAGDAPGGRSPARDDSDDRGGQVVRRRMMGGQTRRSVAHGRPRTRTRWSTLSASGAATEAVARGDRASRACQLPASSSIRYGSISTKL